MSFSPEELDVVLPLTYPLPPESRMAFLEAVAGALAARPVRGVGLAYRLAVDLQRSFFVPPASISRPQHLTARRLRMAAERTPLHRSRRGAL